MSLIIISQCRRWSHFDVFSYETGNNIISEESGYLKDINDDNPAGTLVQKGSYSYETPDGQVGLLSLFVYWLTDLMEHFIYHSWSTLNIKPTKRVSACMEIICLHLHQSLPRSRKVLIWSTKVSDCRRSGGKIIQITPLTKRNERDWTT